MWVCLVGEYANSSDGGMKQAKTEHVATTHCDQFAEYHMHTGSSLQGPFQDTTDGEKLLDGTVH